MTAWETTEAGALTPAVSIAAAVVWMRPSSTWTSAAKDPAAPPPESMAMTDDAAGMTSMPLLLALSTRLVYRIVIRPLLSAVALNSSTTASFAPPARAKMS